MRIRRRYPRDQFDPDCREETDCRRSMPSLSHSWAKIMATSAALGESRCGRGFGSGSKLHVRLPELWRESTSTAKWETRCVPARSCCPCPEASWRFRPEDRPAPNRRRKSCPHPRAAPMTGMPVDLRRVEGQAAHPSFFSSTVLCSAMRCATSRPPTTLHQLFSGIVDRRRWRTSTAGCDARDHLVCRWNSAGLDTPS